ncbi:ABC transporter permease [Bythopirellula polymerisocia]|uniref:ABC-2 family transporter protein n=1 Tax=Bythopirellula polymerisocia TaxID=2528003 RepID=A0A5C6CHR4_9BACT|nr:hypothetical protein [Bythopirellula polymerisocia]TWU22821.1 hypothetical protein Pla144_42820 [Bythopirellula polymerisocia]
MSAGAVPNPSPVTETIERRNSAEIITSIAHWAEQFIDRLNPILVKETRQALKSRQFVATFLVVLIACWAASFAVVAIIGPDVYYVASGQTMLLVYASILAFPLILIVPFSAFRSLAAEQEDNTYELLSITSLSAKQIISGKLGSAAVQMMIYMCGVSPCIAFTYLLRGVDTLTIAFILAYFMFLCMGLSMLGLLAGTNAKARHTHVLISLLVVLCLTIVLGSTITSLPDFVEYGFVNLQNSWFWLGSLAALSFYLTLFALVHAAAAAQIGFSSDNRSTPLRKRMIALHACFIGWISIIVLLTPTTIDYLLRVILIAAAGSVMFWYAMGTFMTSEWPHLSRRVMRSLPSSTLGRMFLTWFNPGPHTGFIFAVSSLAAVTLAGLLTVAFLPNSTRWPTRETVCYFLLLSWCYCVIFLGVGKMIISWMRTITFVQLSAGFLIHLILLLLACGIPQVIYMMTPSLRMGSEFTYLQACNPIWTLVTLIDNGPMAIEAFTLLSILGPFAIVVVILNIRPLVTEVQYLPRAIPERVVQDEIELHPPPASKPTSPWEESSSKL